MLTGKKSVLVCAMIVAMTGVIARAGEEKPTFTLGKYVPKDVWLFLTETKNPERDFIHAHWEKVFAALADARIDKEIKRLISDKLETDEQRDEFNKKWDELVSKFMDIPWNNDVGSEEFVMAQRISFPMPSYIFLFKNTPGTSPEIAQKMGDLLTSLASLTDECTVMNKNRHNAKVSSLCLGDMGSLVEVFSHGDVVGLTIGKGISDEVLGLMAGKSSSPSLVSTDRFKKALLDVPAAEGAMFFFDMRAMFRQTRSMMNNVIKEKNNDNAQVRDVVFKAFEHFDVIDYVVMTRRQNGLKEVTSARVNLRPDRLDKPFVKSMLDQKPFERFDQFVPQNATGFFVTTGMNFEVMYDGFIDFMQNDMPAEGKQMLANWAGFQEQMGFDAKKDVLGWMSGEMISVTLPGMMGSSSNGVFMVRTSDPKTAWEKVTAGLSLLDKSFEQVTVNPAPNVNADGFVSVFHPMMGMMQVQPVVGMYEDWLVVGTKPNDVNACLAVASGESKSIRENERFKSEGLMPTNAVVGASFTDMSRLGEEMGMAFGMMGMVGAMMPPEKELEPMKAMFALLARLAPVMQKIDFYSSSSTITHYQNNGWTSEYVTTYKPYNPPPSPETAKN